MSITVRPFNAETDQALVNAWRRTWRWPEVPEEWLSDDGLLLFHDGTPAAAGWLYSWGGKLGWFEFVVTNPSVRHQSRTQSLEGLRDALESLARRRGLKVTLALSSSPRIKGVLERGGYMRDRNNLTSMVKVL